MFTAQQQTGEAQSRAAGGAGDEPMPASQSDAAPGTAAGGGEAGSRGSGQ